MQLERSMFAILDDRAAVTDVGYRFLWALDTRNWDSLGVICAAGISAEWDDPAGSTLNWCNVAEMREGLRALIGGAISHHQATNELAEAGANSATLRSLIVARYRAATMRGNDWCTVYAEQYIGLQRDGVEWRIASIRHVNLSVDGNPAVMSLTARATSADAATAFVPQPPAQMLAQRLAYQTDRNAIADLMMHFGRALDQKDWRAFRACFGDRLILDFSQTTGASPHDVDPDLFVEFTRLRQRFHASFHQYSNFQVAIDGDQARCILYVAARHRIVASGGGDPLNVFVGWYENDFARGSDGWKVSVLRLPLQWVEGNALIKDAPDPEVAEISRRMFAKKEGR